MKYIQTLVLFVISNFLCACALVVYEHEISSNSVEQDSKFTENEFSLAGNSFILPMPKRVAPPTVAPLLLDDLQIEVIQRGKERGFKQNGGFISVKDKVTKEELWTLKIYTTTYDDRLESDVEDVFIESLTKGINKGTIYIVDERNRHYVVDLKTRIVREK